MKELYVFILSWLKSLLDTKNLAKLIATVGLKLSGFKAWLASFFIKKAIEKGKDEVTNGIDKVQDKSAKEQLKKEMSKPYKEIDWQKVDRLEREILEGK